MIKGIVGFIWTVCARYGLISTRRYLEKRFGILPIHSQQTYFGGYEWRGVTSTILFRVLVSVLAMG